MQLQDILTHFDNVKQEGRQYKANCPNCSDTHQHLYISSTDDKIVLHCKKGCSFDDIVQATGLKKADFFNTTKKADFFNATKKQAWKFLREHVYTDRAGQPIAKKQVYDTGNGKQCVWYRCENNAYIKGLNGLKMPLYHLHNVITCTDRIFIAEGEKDVETVERMGFTATTSPNGAGSKWSKSYNSYLQGFDVIALADNDEAGEKHALDIAESLSAGVRSVKIIPATAIYPQVKAKGDISDIVSVVGIDEAKRLLLEAIASAEPFQEPQRVVVPVVQPDVIAVQTKADNSVLDKLGQLNAHLKYSPNDKGNSDLFSDVFKDVLRYNRTNKTWYFYNGKLWTADIEGMYTSRLAKSLYENLMLFGLSIPDEVQRNAFIKHVSSLGTRRNRQTMIDDSRDKNFIESKDFDRDVYLFNCQNGTYDLKNNYFRRHNAKDLISKISNVVYDENAESKDFEKFIKEVFQGDMSYVNYLQRVLGYSLTGDTTAECFWIFYGKTTRNGKGTLCSTIEHLFGENAGVEPGYSATATPETFASKQNKDSRTASGDVARLAGVRFLTSSEPDHSMIFDTALLKALTGGDTITARELYSRETQYRPQFSLFFNTNYLPYINDESIFSSDRVKVIPFEKHFSQQERDTTLKARLKSTANISGLFNWLIKGWKLYQREGFCEPLGVTLATAGYRSRSDKVQAFIDERVEGVEGEKIKVKDLHSAYTIWCQSRGQKAEGFNTFLEKISLKYVVKDRDRVEGKQERNVISDIKIAC